LASYEFVKPDLDKEILERNIKRREIHEKYNLLSKEQVEVKGYRFILNKGNNHNLVKRVMSTRLSWLQIPSLVTSIYDFKWTPYSSQIKFNFLGKHG